MQIEIINEIENLQNAKQKLIDKLTSYFEGKWTIAIDYREKKYRMGSNPTLFLKNKHDEFIVFKINKCRPKSTLSNYLDLKELVLEGTDPFGAERSINLLRKEIAETRSGKITLPGFDPNNFNYDVLLFETAEEAKLYAELTMALETGKGL